MHKLLSILLAAALLLCGCAAPAPQPAESSSVPDAPPQAESFPEAPQTHEVKGVVNHNAHFMNLTMAVPVTWDFDPERPWVLVANGKDVVEFFSSNLLDQGHSIDDVENYDWTSTDEEYRSYENYMDEGFLNVPGMAGKYYVSELEHLDDNTVIHQTTCFLRKSNQHLVFYYLSDSGVSLDELSPYLATILITDDPSFVKIQVGCDKYSYGVFALDYTGELYFGSYTVNEPMYWVESQVKDFSCTSSGLYILKESGEVFYCDTRIFEPYKPLTLIHPGTDAPRISGFIVYTPEQNLSYLSLETQEWKALDISPWKVDADYWGAAILDTSETLWFFDRAAESLEKISENVIDCSYQDRNKLYYVDALWYVTSDGEVSIYSARDSLAESLSKPITDAISITASTGYYFSGGSNGKYRLGSVEVPDIATELDLPNIDTLNSVYAFLDRKGDIHIGTLDPEQGLLETRVISHP